MSDIRLTCVHTMYPGF